MKRHDYLPFGEELFAPTGGRTAAQGYAGGDGIRQQFTKKERDVETGLDYFLARYYSSRQGRFISPDEFSGGPTELFAEVAAHNPWLLMLGARQEMRKTSRLWLILPALLFFLKDTIAALAILATEPGITPKAKLYYAFALLSGSLVGDDASPATIVNVLFGASSV